jgi:3-phytase
MPNPNWPDDASTPTIQADFYNNAEKNAFRLSSKSHWDLPIDLGNGHLFRFLTSHPTPPSFDGAEDRNGRRNHDEIRFWADYITPGQAGHIKDDASALGGIAPQSRFVIAGDLNADPQDGDSFQRAARLLTQHPLLQTSFVPTSNGGPAAAASQGGANNAHTGPAAQDTADFSDAAPGNLRVDYVLPSQTGWRVLGGGVFWPTTSEPGAALVGVSDHRLVWMDLAPIPQLELAIAQLRAATENGQLILRWISAAGYTYAVESATWLSGPWQKEMSMVPTISGSAAQAVDSAPSPGKKFYRLRIGFAL